MRYVSRFHLTDIKLTFRFFQARQMVAFQVTYYIRPVRNLLSIQSLFQVNREIVVSGFIVDFDADNNRFICNVSLLLFLQRMPEVSHAANSLKVTGINITSGQDNPKVAFPAVKMEDTVQTPSGRVRGKL